MDSKSLNFIEHIIEEDLAQGMPSDALRFRFPPEPNGYLHIGHVKAICLNFNLGLQYKAPVNLRFDDTNPAAEETKFVQAIQQDITWLGYQWDSVCYASDYFEQLYAWAEELIQHNLAYVDSQDSQTIADQKGTPTEPGCPSPYRDRDVSENLRLFREMRDGKHADGTHVLRARIDMASPNMLLRDPIMYRIMHTSHHRTGDTWCIYPMYDWTHGQSDFKEQISHSFCSLEFKPHRDLYDWFLDQLDLNQQLRPKQREFARLNLAYTVTSKRKLKELIDNAVVQGWDDPRMPTIAGLRKRGYTSNALRNFVNAVGVAKRENLIDMALLEHAVREDLNFSAPRVNAVLNPIKLTIENYPGNHSEILHGEINPEQPELGTREIPFSKHLYIEQEDFKEEANRKFFRLTLGKEVRLKNAYIIKGERVIKDEKGNITEIICSYDPDSRSGSGTEASQRKVKGTLHWVSIQHAIPADVHLYDRLYSDPTPDKHEDSHLSFINPNSHQLVEAWIEPSLLDAIPGTQFQFQRLGYFVLDNKSDERLSFNKTVGLRDTWAKIQQD